MATPSPLFALPAHAQSQSPSPCYCPCPCQSPNTSPEQIQSPILPMSSDKIIQSPVVPIPPGQMLYVAAHNGQADKVKALCERWEGDGEVINWAHPYTGNTPLYDAAYSIPECMDILLSTKGIDVNKGNKDGMTPLWKAAYMGEPETVQALLAAPGIDLNKAPTGGWKGNIGKSPLTIARENPGRMNGCKEVVRLLEAAGAKPSKGGKIKTRKNKRSKKNKRKTSSNLYRRRI